MTKKNLQYLSLFILSLSVILIASCSSDDDSENKIPAGELGTIKLEFGGDDEGSGSGSASFHMVINSYWELGGSDEEGAFDIGFKTHEDPDANPEVGTYLIGDSNEEFFANFSLKEDGKLVKAYSSLHSKDGGQTGTLEITRSEKEKIEGKFDFKAYYDQSDIGEDEDLIEVRVKGEFSAVKGISPYG